MDPRRRMPVLVLGVLALGACTADEPPDRPSAAPTSTSASTTSPAPTTATPTPTPTVVPSTPEGFSTEPVASPTFPGLGGDLGGVGLVRVGRHGSFDRVVWEFQGTGRPTFTVRYVDEPLGDGSGDPVAVRGDAYLEVLVTSVGNPEEGTARPADASPGELAGTVIAEAMAVYGGFEGYGQAFIGVRDRERPFRAFVLTGPTRLVVDVATG